MKIEKYVFSVPQPHVPLQIHGQYQREEIYLRTSPTFHRQVWLGRILPMAGSICFVITYLWIKGCLRRERLLGKEARIVSCSSDITIQIRSLIGPIVSSTHSHILAKWSFTRNFWKWPRHFQGHQRLECLQGSFAHPQVFTLRISSFNFRLSTKSGVMLDQPKESSSNLKFALKFHTDTHTPTYTKAWLNNTSSIKYIARVTKQERMC